MASLVIGLIAIAVGYVLAAAALLKANEVMNNEKNNKTKKGNT